MLHSAVLDGVGQAVAWFNVTADIDIILVHYSIILYPIMHGFSDFVTGI
jgi:hypothetical protein